MDLMYEIPSDESIRTCLVTKEMITGEGEAELSYREEQPSGRRKRRLGAMEETA